MARTSLLLRFLVATASAVAAQSATVAPSNTTSYSAPPDGILYLTTYCKGISPVQINPLTSSSQGAIQNYNTNARGQLMTVGPSNSTNVAGVAYVSCDPQDYSGGRLNVNDFVTSVLTSPSAGVVVLYSLTSKYCNISNVPGQDISLFTVVGADRSKQLLGLDTEIDILPGAAIKNISAPLCGTNGTINSPEISSQSTAVAMIVLYSITGVIAALFLLIIVSGAIRAHRHPEQYGPSQILGRPRQSRAKGIARAMLDTIPIVKFGEHHDTTKNMDAELATLPSTTSPPPHTAAGTDPDEPREVSDTMPKDGTAAGPETIATDAGVAPLTVVPAAADHSHAGADDSADPESGLSCSICTEEFSRGEDIRLLPCNHKYHPACVDPWLLNVSGTCPLCRIDLRPPKNAAVDEEEEEGDNTESNDAPQPSTAAAVPEASERQQGRRNAFRNLIDRARMQRASPEERIAALRTFREANRASVSTSPTQGSNQAGGEGEAPQSQRSRAWNRLSGLVPEDIRMLRSGR